MAAVVITSFVIALLYIGRGILIPLALAALLSFLLSPIVAWLERWIGRLASTLVAVAILFAVIGGIGWVLTREMVELASHLPDYRQNIESKLKAIHPAGAGRFSAFTQTVSELKNELPKVEAVPASATTVAPVTPSSRKVTHAGIPEPPLSHAAPTPVEVVETTQGGVMGQLAEVFSSVLGSLGNAALILLLLFCMLINREDMRGRLIRLIGSGNISATTRGLDDAAKRVSRFVLLQSIVNICYGAIIGTGLYFIGVPNYFIWGVLTAVLRFIPYMGVCLASIFPIALSLAVSTSWTMPLFTIGLYVVVEMICNNIVENVLYGSSTGVSSIALIIAAVFWTWIWGFAGLVLATPLTVCLVVIGRHVPRLMFLSVLFSDEQALAPHEEFYHRMLNPNTAGTSNFSSAWLKTHTHAQLYDLVLIPALASVERDYLIGQLDKEQHARLLQEVRELIEDLGTRPIRVAKPDEDRADPDGGPAASTCSVICLSVKSDRDEVAALMLTQLLNQSEFSANCLPAKTIAEDIVNDVSQDHAEIVCLSVTPPSTVLHARALCGKLHARIPKLHIIVGLWGALDDLAESTARLREVGADCVVTTLEDAVLQSSRIASQLSVSEITGSPAGDELDRIAELDSLNLLDTDAEPEFDRITQRVAHVLDMPIALVSLIAQDRQFFKSQSGLPREMSGVRETPRVLSICSHVVAANAVLVVADLAQDRRFRANPLVKEQGLRFYAGAPLRGRDNHVLGSLCVLDRKPRRFGDSEKRFLQLMADEVMAVIGARVSEKV